MRLQWAKVVKEMHDKAALRNAWATVTQENQEGPWLPETKLIPIESRQPHSRPGVSKLSN